MAGTALLGQVGNQLQHQRDIGPIALEAPLLRHRQQTGVGHRFQMERQIVRRNRQLAGDLPGHHPLEPGFHQQAVDLQPDAGGQGFKYLGRYLFVHGSIIQELLK